MNSQKNIPLPSNSAGCDFVEIFPPELSNKLFTYICDEDLFSSLICSSSWYTVTNNNPQWKPRCIRRGWTSKVAEDNEKRTSIKWPLTKSHVSKNDFFKFRPSPGFPRHENCNDALVPLCDWALYYRQCSHLKHNWEKGIYVIHRLTIPEEFITEPLLFNTSASNDEFLVAGTHGGDVYVWSIDGIPSFLHCINSKSSEPCEVDMVRLTSKHLFTLYNDGSLKIFSLKSTDSEHGTVNFEALHKLKVEVSSTNRMGDATVNAHFIPDEEELYENGDEEGDESIETWIRGLFRDDFWSAASRNDSYVSEVIFHTNEKIMVLTCLSCKSFLFWDIKTSNNLINTLVLNRGGQIYSEGYLSRNKLYLPNRRSSNQQENGGNVTYTLLIYDIDSLLKEPKSAAPIEFEIASNAADASEIMIKSDVKDSRFVYATQQEAIRGIRLNDGVVLFNHELSAQSASPFVDNLTVSEDVIVYHQFNGFLVGLNWQGEILYRIEAHLGLVKGLECFGNLMVSGGDARQLFVWDLPTGRKLHAVFHQPGRIHHLYLHATNIITVGRVDMPVHIGYW